MLDPIPPPPQIVSQLTQPLADALGLKTLPFHIHEVILAFAVYTWVNFSLAPVLSSKLFPTIYRNLAPRTKVNWDVHVVSLFQSCTINFLALWVMYVDQERKEMSWQERVWGYTGAGGMIQGFAAGYFVWDLMITLMNIDCFGYSMLAHAISALTVFSLGFRPFVNFYGPTFILYEMSSPFLNIHWFFDKTNMTGTRAQLINGLLLLVTFFSCRLVWGTYQSVRVYQDVWAALQAPRRKMALGNATMSAVTEGAGDSVSEMMMFAGDEVVPVWLAIVYLGSNVVLNTLNFYWFGKMIEALRKRFQQPSQAEKTVHSNGDATTSVKASGADVDYATEPHHRVVPVETEDDVDIVM
ncbi:MAG: hypothetical protein M1838_004062 [Thelocarpon superellum]|nr:MAG: hypothetical protein M1838_004062 [Thelocarpon superellum]